MSENSWRDLPIGEYAFPGPLRDKLVAALLDGSKTSTTSLLCEFAADEPLPAVGDRELVIDSNDRPVCITENTAVCVVRLGDVDLAHAIAEGEGYESVADWRAGHEAFWHSSEFREEMGDPEFTVDDDTQAVLVTLRVTRLSPPSRPGRPN